jgi:hypothetical protein
MRTVTNVIFRTEDYMVDGVIWEEFMVWVDLITGLISQDILVLGHISQDILV